MLFIPILSAAPPPLLPFCPRAPLPLTFLLQLLSDICLKRVVTCCSMGADEVAAIRTALGLLASHFLADQLSVVVLLNFVTSMYALAAFATKVLSSDKPATNI